MDQYIKKPVMIRAFQMTQARRKDNSEWPQWLHEKWQLEPTDPNALYPSNYPDSDGTDELEIFTLEGVHRVSFDDWIIQGIAGEIYPCKPDIFEATYVSAGDPSSMNFGQAIEAAKAGSKIARAGWNGKNMWVALTPGSSFDAVYAKPGHAAHHRAREFGDDVGSAGIDLLPHFDMRAADGSMVVGWLASQTDMLADDWCVVE